MTIASITARASFLFAVLGCSAKSPNAPALAANGVDPPQAVEPATDASVQAVPEAVASAAPAGQSAAAAPDKPAAPKRERIRIYSNCNKQMNLRIERVHGSDTMTSLTSNTGMEEHASDGDEIRLLDDKRNLIHALTIEPNFKEVHIMSGCAKLEGK